MQKGFKSKISKRKNIKTNKELFNDYINYVKNEIKRIQIKSIKYKKAMKKTSGVYVEEIVKFPPMKKIKPKKE